MMTKEQIYDEQINPLMAQILEICTAHNIAMAASFAIPNDEDDHLCCSSKRPDETGKFPHLIGKLAAVIDREIRGREPTMMTTVDADGRKTMLAIIS